MGKYGGKVGNRRTNRRAVLRALVTALTARCHMFDPDVPPPGEAPAMRLHRVVKKENEHYASQRAGYMFSSMISQTNDCILSTWNMTRHIYRYGDILKPLLFNLLGVHSQCNRIDSQSSRTTHASMQRHLHPAYPLTQSKSTTLSSSSPSCMTHACSEPSSAPRPLL